MPQKVAKKPVPVKKPVAHKETTLVEEVVTPTPRFIPRLFEVIVHLEQALYHMNYTGITLTGSEQAKINELREVSIHQIREMLLVYRGQWEEARKQFERLQ